jgi:hypothetical protein
MERNCSDIFWGTLDLAYNNNNKRIEKKPLSCQFNGVLLL